LPYDSKVAYQLLYSVEERGGLILPPFENTAVSAVKEGKPGSDTKEGRYFQKILLR